MAKLGEGLEFKYESIIPQAPMDMKFHYWDELEDGTKVLKSQGSQDRGRHPGGSGGPGSSTVTL